MGLADIVRGMRNGPRGEQRRNDTGRSGWGSRLMMAALGLLAYKAFSGRNNDSDRGRDNEPPRRRWL
jgi:hypothetical protein